MTSPSDPVSTDPVSTDPVSPPGPPAPDAGTQTVAAASGPATLTAWASSAVARAERWIDLDAGPPPAPVRRRPVGLALVAAAVVGGALAGAVLASTGRAELPPAPPPTVAVMTLDTLVLDPVPSAVLALRVDNLGRTRQVVREVHVSGGGAADAVLPIGQELPVGGGLDTRVVVALRCGASPAADAARISATVRVTSADGAGPATARPDIPAVSVGRAARLGGICAAADAVLPGGWRTPARVTGQRMDGGELDLTVGGLTADATRIVWIEADGVLLPQSRLDPAVRNGSARLRLPAPTPGCRDSGLRPVVPTGLQLHLATPGGLRSAYAPVGAMVAQWMMDAYLRACPGSPAGPPAMPLS